MNKEFKVNILTHKGMLDAKSIVERFDCLLEQLKLVCEEGRSFSIVRTKLEEACFFAKKAIAEKPENYEFCE